MSKLLPLLLLLLGIGGGVGAGIALRPVPAPPMAEGCGPADPAMAAGEMAKPPAKQEAEAETGAYDYVKLNNQFVIPVVNGEAVEALVIMSLSLEVPEGSADIVYQHEPKLRDRLLEVLFEHANMGGFSGMFTSPTNMDVLRAALKDAAQMILGKAVTQVLITDMARQDR